MPNKRYFVFVIVGLFFIQNTYSQNFNDTILMLNGNIILTNVIESNDSLTRIVNPKKLTKNIIIENDRIFSIKNKTRERIIYEYDSVRGNDLTVDEMRYFILGEQDAQKGFKPRGALIGGIIIGAASGITGSFLSPIPPFAFSSLVGIPRVKVNRRVCSNPDLVHKEAYLLGYERVAIKKRRVQSLVGGGAGLIAGLVSWGILKGNGVEVIK